MIDFLDVNELQRDPVEWKKHLDTIEILAEQSGAPRTEVGRLYQAELERIDPTTRVRDFLPVLIARKVKEDLRRRDGKHPAARSEQ